MLHLSSLRGLDPSVEPRGPRAGTPGPWTQRLITLTTLMLLTTAVACGDDDNDAPVDAGTDAPQAQCRPADCANIALPTLVCDNGGVLSATCARGSDQRCTWTQTRCSAPVGDASFDGADGGDGGAKDAGDAGGDASDAGDGGSDASDARDGADAVNLDAVAG